MIRRIMMINTSILSLTLSHLPEVQMTVMMMIVKMTLTRTMMIFIITIIIMIMIITNIIIIMAAGVIFLHGYRAQSGSVAGKRHSFEMVGIPVSN